MTSNCMPHKECCHTGENITDTDFGYTLSLINGKYKLIIIYWLAQHKPVMRYNELMSWHNLSQDIKCHTQRNGE